MNKAVIKREALESIKQLEYSLQSYVDKNPDKEFSTYVKKQNKNINALKLFYNMVEENEQTTRLNIDQLKNRIDKLEKSIVTIIDTLIMLDYNAAFHALTSFLQYTPDTLHKIAHLRTEVLKKFDLTRFFNVLEKHINS
jgi:archaellum biogenesis ATPase FlaH